MSVSLITQQSSIEQYFCLFVFLISSHFLEPCLAHTKCLVFTELTQMNELMSECVGTTPGPYLVCAFLLAGAVYVCVDSQTLPKVI